MKKILVFFIFLPIMSVSQINWDEVKVKSTQLAPDLHRLFIGEGVAMLAYFGEDDVLLVDAAYDRTDELVKEELEKLGNANIRYIINTHYHGDHTGGNKKLGQNADIISHHYVKDLISKDRGEEENKREAFPEFAQPNITFSDSLAIRYNNQTISLIHLPGGHTAGDILVYFPDSKVLSMGDLLFADMFPYVDINHGGNALEYIKHLEWIAKKFPANVQIIGGHGPVYSIEKLKNYHTTLDRTVQIVKNAKEKGKTLEEMKERRILKEWEEYGTDFISEDFWIETVYHSL